MAIGPQVFPRVEHPPSGRPLPPHLEAHEIRPPPAGTILWSSRSPLLHPDFAVDELSLLASFACCIAENTPLSFPPAATSSNF